VRRTSLARDSELSATLPQLPLLMQFRLVHVLPGDLPTRSDPIASAQVGHLNTHLLHLSDDLVGHIGVSLRKVAASVDRNASLISGFHVQGTLGVESVLFERRVLKVGVPCVDTGYT
jgi:hypothetical protein